MGKRIKKIYVLQEVSERDSTIFETAFFSLKRAETERQLLVSQKKNVLLRILELNLED